MPPTFSKESKKNKCSRNKYSLKSKTIKIFERIRLLGACTTKNGTQHFSRNSADQILALPLSIKRRTTENSVGGFLKKTGVLKLTNIIFRNLQKKIVF